MEMITYSVVPDDERGNFVYQQLGRLGDNPQVMLRFEGIIFQSLSSMTNDYSGGFWKFGKISNGGFFMYPDSEHKFTLFSPNGSSAEVSAETAGIVACLFAFSNMSFMFEDQDADEVIPKLYYSLRELAFVSPEAGAIFELID